MSGRGSRDKAVPDPACVPMLEGENRACFRVLGVRVDALQIPNVCAIIEQWVQDYSRCRYIAVTGMHGVMEAHHDPEFKRILNSADLVVADGMPLVWLSRLKGIGLKRRVYGPELMLSVCQQKTSKRLRHFLFGGAPGVADRLAIVLQDKYPGLEIVGTCSPPFRPLTLDEDEKLVASMNRTSPDVVWVGLSTPMQERWMHEHRGRLNASVLLGVGAAFDLHAGIKKQAPGWMRGNGMEWLFRLLQEPRRLWRRYLVYGSQFIFYVLLELAGIRKE
jgi:N-acetylglucosaminyldiphosphoundecaprenol N-acetyl-beta-D-mannosaminyltransferase